MARHVYTTRKREKSIVFCTGIGILACEVFDVQYVITGWGPSTIQNPGHNLIRRIIIIVGQYQWAQVNIIRCTGRTVDLNWPDNSIAVLR